jgi:hypothetical protein
MTTSLPFQQQFTWRKLGFLFFTDSLSYREVLEQNPQWRVNKLPPLGAQLRISSLRGITNGLSQGGFVFGLPAADTADIFPFGSQKSYTEALVRYSPSAVKNRVVVNGYTLDSEIVTKGG